MFSEECLIFSRFIYPSFVAFLVGGCLFPPGLGQFMAGEVRTFDKFL